jgi:hypothetical protein
VNYLKWVVIAALLAMPAAADELERFLGEWQGESICLAQGPSCHDETVVYRIARISDRPGVATVSANKLVNGNPVNTGTMEYRHQHNELICENGQFVWRMKLYGDKMLGTLERSGKALIWRVTLERKP